MIGRGGAGGVALAGSVLAAVTLLGVPGAAAAPPSCTIVLSTPPAASPPPTFASARPAFQGQFSVSGDGDASRYHAEQVRLTFASADHRPVPGVATINGTSPATLGFDYTPASPGFAFNGQYDVAVAAHGHDDGIAGLVGQDDCDATLGPRPFRVAVPPAAPVQVEATVGNDRTVHVTWSPGHEPDLVADVVSRSTDGGAAEVRAAIAPDVATYTDDTTAAAGGTYRYLVSAARLGADGEASRDVPAGQILATSPYTISATAEVPAPPPTTTPGTAPGDTTSTTAAGGSTPSSGPGGSATTTKKAANPPPPVGNVDLNAYGALLDRAKAKQLPGVDLPDAGFQETLPFVTTIPAEDGSGESDPAVISRRPLGEGGPVDHRTLAVFAGGLLAIAVLMHLLWLRRAVRDVPGPSLTLETADAMAPPPPTDTLMDEPNVAVVGGVRPRPARSPLSARGGTRVEGGRGL